MSNQTFGDTSLIECPYCGKYIRDLWDYGNGLEEDMEIECPHCGKISTLGIRYEYSLSTLPDKPQKDG